jgi:hypothetical protein
MPFPFSFLQGAIPCQRRSVLLGQLTRLFDAIFFDKDAEINCTRDELRARNQRSAGY